MALWNIIRDFIVQYIFGGNTSTGQRFSGFFGSVHIEGSSSTSTFNNVEVLVPVNMFKWSGEHINGVTVGDWLSTTTTIIVLGIFVIVLFLLLKWLFKTISGLILLK